MKNWMGERTAPYTRQIFDRVGRVGIIRSDSSFESNSVDSPVSPARRDSVSCFPMRSLRSLRPI